MSLNLYSNLQYNYDFTHLKNKAIIKVNRPINLRAARRVGYKAKLGFHIAQIKIKKGSRITKPANAARRTKTYAPRYTLNMSNKRIAQNRVARRFRPLEVINSYKVAEKDAHNYFEVILYDPTILQLQKNYKGSIFRSA